MRMFLTGAMVSFLLLGFGVNGAAQAAGAAPTALSAETDTTPMAYASWGSLQQEIQNNPTRVYVVQGTASWCGPCQILKATVHNLIDSYASQGLFYRLVDVDQNRNFPVQGGIPTVIAYKNAQKVDSFVGSISDQEVRAFFDKQLRRTYQDALTSDGPGTCDHDCGDCNNGTCCEEHDGQESCPAQGPSLFGEYCPVQ